MGNPDKFTLEEAEAYASQMLGRPWGIPGGKAAYIQKYGHGWVDKSAFMRDIQNSTEYRSKQSGGSGASGSAIASGYSTSPVPQLKSINLPEGRVVVTPDGEIRYEESEAYRKKREETEKLMAYYRGELDQPSYQQSLDEFEKEYYDQTWAPAETALTQSLAQKRMLGDLKGALAELASNISDQAKMRKHDLKQSYDTSILNALNALQSGLSADEAKKLQTMGMAQADADKRAALELDRIANERNFLENQRQFDESLAYRQDSDWYQQELNRIAQGANEKNASRANTFGTLTTAASIAKLFFSCLPEGTRVERGESKPYKLIEHIRIGDRIKGGKVLEVSKQEVNQKTFTWYEKVTDKGTIICSVDHPVLERVKEVRPSKVKAKYAYDILTESGCFYVGGVKVGSTLGGGEAA